MFAFLDSVQAAVTSLQVAGLLPFLFHPGHRPVFSPSLLAYGLSVRCVLFVAALLQLDKIRNSKWHSLGDVAYDGLIFTYGITVHLGPCSLLLNSKKAANLLYQLSKPCIKNSAQKKKTKLCAGFVSYLLLGTLTVVFLQFDNYYFVNATFAGRVMWHCLLFLFFADILVFVNLVKFVCTSLEGYIKITSSQLLRWELSKGRAKEYIRSFENDVSYNALLQLSDEVDRLKQMWLKLIGSYLTFFLLAGICLNIATTYRLFRTSGISFMSSLCNCVSNNCHFFLLASFFQRLSDQLFQAVYSFDRATSMSIAGLYDFGLSTYVQISNFTVTYIVLLVQVGAITHSLPGQNF